MLPALLSLLVLVLVLSLCSEDNKMCVTDLNSTNGTVVNGQELSPMDNIEVEVGSEVIFGER